MKIKLLILIAASCVLGSPLVQDVKDVDVLSPSEDKSKITTTNNKLRQDGDGEDAAVEGLEAVAGPVAQIISGTLSGNIGQLFGGITGTVTDQEVQPGVGTILQGVSIPLSTLWASGISAGQKYFNITTQPPPLAEGQQAAGQQRPQAQQGGVQQRVQQQQQPIRQQVPQQQVQSAPSFPSNVRPQRPAQAPVTASSGDDDDEDEGESDQNKKL